LAGERNAAEWGVLLKEEREKKVKSHRNYRESESIFADAIYGGKRGDYRSGIRRRIVLQQMIENKGGSHRFCSRKKRSSRSRSSKGGKGERILEGGRARRGYEKVSLRADGMQIMSEAQRKEKKKGPYVDTKTRKKKAHQRGKVDDDTISLPPRNVGHRRGKEKKKIDCVVTKKNGILEKREKRGGKYRAQKNVRAVQNRKIPSVRREQADLDDRTRQKNSGKSQSTLYSNVEQKKKRHPRGFFQKEVTHKV